MTLLGPIATAGKETPTATYEPLAPHYDAYRSAPEYACWLAGLLAFAAEHGFSGGRALDVGCGTGVSLQALIAAGCEASGTDPSPAMLGRARDRLGPGVQLGVSALPEPLPDGPEVDLVTAFNDVLNYVKPESLGRSFAVLADRMRSGGLLLFDANTPLAYTLLSSAPRLRDTGEHLFIWEPIKDAEADATTHRADLHAFARDPDDPAAWRRTVSHHVQHCHPHDEMVAALASAGLELVAVRGAGDGGDLDPVPDETRHIKRVYLARLP